MVSWGYSSALLGCRRTDATATDVSNVGHSLRAGAATTRREGLRIMTQLVGRPAVPFALRDAQGGEHRLEDYRGQWLLLMFHRHLF